MTSSPPIMVSPRRSSSSLSRNNVTKKKNKPNLYVSTLKASTSPSCSPSVMLRMMQDGSTHRNGADENIFCIATTVNTITTSRASPIHYAHGPNHCMSIPGTKGHDHNACMCHDSQRAFPCASGDHDWCTLPPHSPNLQTQVIQSCSCDGVSYNAFEKTHNTATITTRISAHVVDTNSKQDHCILRGESMDSNDVISDDEHAIFTRHVSTTPTLDHHHATLLAESITQKTITIPPCRQHDHATIADHPIVSASIVSPPPIKTSHDHHPIKYRMRADQQDHAIIVDPVPSPPPLSGTSILPLLTTTTIVRDAVPHNGISYMLLQEFAKRDWDKVFDEKHQIGNGAHGTVYSYHSHIMDQELVIKMQPCSTPIEEDRILHEVDTLRRITQHLVAHGATTTSHDPEAIHNTLNNATMTTTPSFQKITQIQQKYQQQHNDSAMLHHAEHNNDEAPGLIQLYAHIPITWKSQRVHCLFLTKCDMSLYDYAKKHDIRLDLMHSLFKLLLWMYRELDMVHNDLHVKNIMIRFCDPRTTTRDTTGINNSVVIMTNQDGDASCLLPHVCWQEMNHRSKLYLIDFGRATMGKQEHEGIYFEDYAYLTALDYLHDMHQDNVKSLHQYRFPPYIRDVIFLLYSMNERLFMLPSMFQWADCVYEEIRARLERHESRQQVHACITSSLYPYNDCQNADDITAGTTVVQSCCHEATSTIFNMGNPHNTTTTNIDMETSIPPFHRVDDFADLVSTIFNEAWLRKRRILV